MVLLAMNGFCEADFSNTPLVEFGDLINHYAEQNLLDPYDVAALIWVESCGDPNAFNEKSKATGLGQVMPYEAGSLFENRPTIEELKDPETNIRWICIVYGYYFHRYHSEFAAAYHYSGGRYWPTLQDFKKRYWTKFKEARSYFYDTGFGDTPSRKHGESVTPRNDNTQPAKFGD